MSESAQSFPRRWARTRRFSLGEPRDIKVSADEGRVVFLRSQGPEDPLNCLWVLDVDIGEERLVFDPRRAVGGRDQLADEPRENDRDRLADGPGEAGRDQLTDEPDLPEAERARRERVRETGEGVVSFDADTGLAAAVFALGGSLWRADLDTGSSAVLPARPGAFDPRLSPDGRRVAYGSGSGLRVVDEHGADRWVIDEPVGAVTWGRAELVAAEEMGRTRGFWWSPDSTRLIVQRTDEARVQMWWISSPADPDLTPAEIRYPAAGTANAEVALAIFNLEDGSRVDVDWAAAPDGTAVAGPAGAPAAPDLNATPGTGSAGAPSAPDSDRTPGARSAGVSAAAGLVGDPVEGSGGWEYLAGVDWSADGLVLVVQSRDQRRLAVLDVDPDTGTCRLRYTVVDDCWVDLVPGAFRLAAGRLVTVEDRGSSRRLCADGRALTPDGVQVRRVVAADEAGAVVTASTDPADVQVVRVSWEGDLEWLTEGPGVNGAAAGGGTAVLVRRSLEHSGSVVTVRSDRAADRVIANRAAASGLDHNVEIVALGPRSLTAAVVLPAAAGAADRLPVLVDPYGGPHAQRVMRSRALFDVPQWFAEQGFAVVIVDGRGTPGRGPEFERAVRGDLAGPVLLDQIDGLEAAAARDPRLDLSRVAIRGWSFGGYLAALAVLRRPDVFHAAVAGAPVTDWRLYDTHYTERYLGHPDAEPANYDRTDLTPAAPGLERPLLLVHGLADDNVAAAHTLRLSRSLLEAGRPHTVLPLSGVTHMTPQAKVAENLLLLEFHFLQTALSLAPHL